MPGRIGGGDPTPGRRRTWNESRGVTIHRRPLDHATQCALLDGRPATGLVAGLPVCAHHQRIVARLAATEAQCPRGARHPVVRIRPGRDAA